MTHTFEFEILRRDSLKPCHDKCHAARKFIAPDRGSRSRLDEFRRSDAIATPAPTGVTTQNRWLQSGASIQQARSWGIELRVDARA